RQGQSQKRQDFLRRRSQKANQEDPALTAEKTDRFVVLLALLNTLPPLYREITTLRSVDGWPFKRIAEDKGLSVSTVKRRFGQAKARLAPLVKRHYFN